MLLEGPRHHGSPPDKCAGLNAKQIARRSTVVDDVPARLIRHLTEEERHFRGSWPARIAEAVPHRKGPGRQFERRGRRSAVVDAWRQWQGKMELTDRFVARVDDLGSRNAGVSEFGPDTASSGFAMSWWRTSRSRAALRPRRSPARAHRRPRRPVERLDGDWSSFIGVPIVSSNRQ